MLSRLPALPACPACSCRAWRSCRSASAAGRTTKTATGSSGEPLAATLRSHCCPPASACRSVPPYILAIPPFEAPCFLASLSPACPSLPAWLCSHPEPAPCRIACSDPDADDELSWFVRPWTEEERKVFADKYLQHHKVGRLWQRRGRGAARCGRLEACVSGASGLGLGV